MRHKNKKKRPGLARAKKRFDRVYQEHLKMISNISFNILVWGPSPDTANPVGAKRLEVLEKLKGLGHNAMFSEDILTPNDGEHSHSEKTKELAQARAADMIITFVEDSPGALAETHDFCNDKEIAPKMYVLVPNAYKDGYSAKGALQLLDEGYGGVYWYKDSEFVSCKVLEKALKRVEARRELIYLNNQRKRGAS